MIMSIFPLLKAAFDIIDFHVDDSLIDRQWYRQGEKEENESYLLLLTLIKISQHLLNFTIFD